MIFNFFDKVYVISLSERQDRRDSIEKEMKKEEIPFVFLNAIKNDIGWVGLMQTMCKLFLEASTNNLKNVLVFEDDATFIFSDIKWRMENILRQLNKDYDCLYLGCNLAIEPERVSANLLKVRAAYSTHAVAYGFSAIKKISDLLVDNTTKEPYDSFLVNNVQKLGRSYCVYPMLVSQKPGWSDIEKKNINYDKILEERFTERTKHL